jgi:hypothetical protein
MKQAALVAASLAVLAQPSLATVKGCYDRVYDAAHLARHKAQRVTAIRLQYGFETGADTPDAAINRLWVKFRSVKPAHEAVVVCEERAPPWECGIEGDGGRFILEETGDGVKITNRDYMRVNDPGGSEEGIEIPADAEHRVFLLRRVSRGPCRP